MVFGYQQIEWLTQEEMDVFDQFTKMLSYCGTLIGTERKKINSMIFWSIVYIPVVAVTLGAVIHYSDNFDLLAYSLHHAVLLINAYLLMIVIVPMYRDQINFFMDGTKKTYNYDSNLVDKFTKDIIRKRFRISRLVLKLMVIGSIGIVLEVQLFFAIEAVWFKSYRTVFPVYIVGLDLDDPMVFVPVVLWQESVVYYTTFLPVVLCVISYSAWSHLDLEMKILNFAIANVHKIVEEKNGRPLSNVVDGQKRSNASMYELYCYHFARHHATIITYFEAFSQAVSWVTPLIFSSGSIMFVSVGLGTMSDNLGIKLKLFWFLVIQMVCTYVWCWIGQYIRDKSEELSEVVTSCRWWLMPKSCRSTLLLMMTRCRKPLTLSTPFGQEANMECFMDMLKAVYQFISVLYQMKSGDGNDKLG